MTFLIIEPLVSTKLKKLLEEKVGINKEREEVQFLPIQMKNKDDPKCKIEGYYLLHILDQVENSIYEWDSKKGNDLMDFGGGLTFKRDKIEGLKIFREKRGNSMDYYINEDIKSILDNCYRMNDYVRYLKYYVK